MFNKHNLGNLVKQAQDMQEKMAKVQEEIERIEVTGEAGAGLIKITINGSYICKKVEIDPSLFEEEKEILEDLSTAAFNDAIRRMSEIKKNKMASVSTNINFPSGFNLSN